MLSLPVSEALWSGEGTGGHAIVDGDAGEVGGAGVIELDAVKDGIADVDGDVFSPAAGGGGGDLFD